MNKIKYLLVVFGFITLFKSNAQSLGTTSTKHFEIGAYYPMILGSKIENTNNAFYDGVIGLDVKYTFKKLPFINLKIGSSFDYYKYGEDIILKGSSIRLNPNLIIGLDLSKFIRLEPYIGIGYSFIYDNQKLKPNFIDFIETDDIIVDESNVSANKNHHDIFYKIGLNYKISKLFYIDTHMYMMDIFEKSDIEEVSDGSLKKVALNIGLGIQF